jgi:hypothetical protein
MFVYVKPLANNISNNNARTKHDNNLPNSKIISNHIRTSKLTNELQPNINNTNHSKLKLIHLSSSDSDDIEMSFSNETESTVPTPVNHDISSLNLENYIENINLSQINTITREEYLQYLTKLVRDEYSSGIISSLISEEKENEKFLSSHKISERLRTQMVDWMIEVLSSYHCDESTFFESVNIMDNYFKACQYHNKILQPQDIHLIGVTSMFIASKYQDIYPLRLKIIHEKIAHQKLSCEEIKAQEEEILKYLNYSFGLPSIWDFICIFIEELFQKNFNQFADGYYELLGYLYNKEMITLLKYVCIYLAKMDYHDYFLSQKLPSLLAAATIYVGVKICEQIKKENYINEYFTITLCELSHKEEIEILKCAQVILYQAKNFDSLFPGLENLKRVHFNALVELRNN